MSKTDERFKCKDVLKHAKSDFRYSLRFPIVLMLTMWLYAFSGTASFLSKNYKVCFLFGFAVSIYFVVFVLFLYKRLKRDLDKINRLKNMLDILTKWS